MALTYSEPGALGGPAPEFGLPGVDGKLHRLSECGGSPAVVVVFMCNHCPYVIAVQERINLLAREYAARGVKVIGINSNDSVKYPDDSFDAMKVRAREQSYSFAYLQDASQEVARAYGAVCTPDFYLLAPEGAQWKVRYRGRLDDNWKNPAAVKRRDLAQAIDQVLAGAPVSDEQYSSLGCSIKWK